MPQTATRFGLRLAFSLAMVAASIGWAPVASAQPTLDQEHTPDLDVHYTAVDMAPEGVRALTRGTVAGGRRFGPRAAWLTQGDLDVLVGAKSGLASIARLRSQLSLVGDFRPGDASRPAAVAIGGRHRFALRHGVGGFAPDGKFADGALGADLVAEGHADHGRVGYGATRFDVGGGRFGDFGAQIGTMLRRGVGGHQAFVFPVRVHYGATRFESPTGGAQWAQRIGADAGFGFKHYFDFHYHGNIEAAGVGWDRFTPSAAPSVDRIELRALRLDDLTFRGRDRLFPVLREKHLLFLRSWVGAHWLTAEEGRRNLGVVAFDLGVGARFPYEKAHAELIVVGGREGVPSTRSGTFVDRYRVESRASIEVREYGFGSDTRVVSAWQSNLETESPYAHQLGVSSSVWIDLARPVTLGVYQRSQRGQPRDGDGFELDRRWRHDLGLFMRFRGGARGGERLPQGPAGYSPFLHPSTD